MVKRTGFAKLGVIILSVVMGLGLMGMGVSYWSDTVSISGTMETGTYGAELIPGTPEPEAKVNYSIDGNTLDIKITGDAVGWYSRDFDIHNTGTVPIKIQNITISSPAEVKTVVNGVSVNDVIEGGGTSWGRVKMKVEVVGNYNVLVTIDTVLWNQ